MLTEATFDTGSVRINYAAGPSGGKPLVLLHGVTTWWQAFLPVMPSFMIRHHTYTLDLRGHGRSGWTPGSYAVHYDVADVITFLRHQVKAPAALLGWSLGGVVATLVAAEAPELVSALILEDPPLAVMTDDDSSQAPFYEHFTALRDLLIQNGSQEERRVALTAHYPDDDDALRRRRLKMYAGFDPENLTFIIEKRKFAGNRLEAVLPRISCPVLLMQSDPSMGGALDDKTAQATVSLLADCAHVRLQNVGHGIHNEQTEMFSRIVSNFLESL